jgi:hypothetical protein
MAKEFNNKFMHPTRRKLVEMIHTGEYDSDIKVGYTKIKDTPTRKVGDVWEDEDGKIWEQKEGFKVKKSKLTDIMSEVRNQLYEKTRCSRSTCSKTGKYSKTDKKVIEKYSYCSSCLSELEHPIRVDGNWETYKTWRVSQDMIKEAQEILDNLNQAYSEVKQEYTYVNSDGTTQTWKLDKPIDEIKADMLTEINLVKDQLDMVIKINKEAYNKLKEFNYEIIV